MQVQNTSCSIILCGRTESQVMSEKDLEKAALVAGGVLLGLVVLLVLAIVGFSFEAQAVAADIDEAQIIEAPAWMNNLEKDDGSIVEKPRAYRDLLDEEGQAAYDAIEKTVRTMSACCFIPMMSWKQVKDVSLAVAADNPDIFWNRYYTLLPSAFSADTLVFIPVYNGGSFEQVKNEHDGFMEEMKRVADGIKGYSRVDTERVISRIAAREVCARLEYGYNGGDQGIEAFFGYYGGETVCAGYSKSFELLCSALGIECYYVVGAYKGKDDGHAWNVFKVDGQNQWIDLTWGDMGNGVNWNSVTVNSDQFAIKHKVYAPFAAVNLPL